MFQGIKDSTANLNFVLMCKKAKRCFAGLCIKQTFSSADSFSCLAFCWIGAKIQITSKYLYGEVIPWNGTSENLSSRWALEISGKLKSAEKIKYSKYGFLFSWKKWCPTHRKGQSSNDFTFEKYCPKYLCFHESIKNQV